MGELSDDFHFAGYSADVESALSAAATAGRAERFWRRDTTLWSEQDVPELADRLGWLDLPISSQAKVAEVTAFASEVKDAGFKHVVLLGMGGSSLAPELFQRVFGNAEGFPHLQVLDSTHPGAVAQVEASADIAKTLFVVSSKSGGTIETMSFFRYFWDKCSRDGNAGDHFVAITDPGSSLEALASQRSFRRVFLAPSDVGGRYSALCEFGLVPAALIGVDIARLLERAAAKISKDGANTREIVTGTALGALAGLGRDKLNIVTSSAIAALPLWIEQLVAESVGKDSVGIVPVMEGGFGAPSSYGDDRVMVAIELDDDPVLSDATREGLTTAGHPVLQRRLHDVYDVGAEFIAWEIITAMAGAEMGIHPFNQPDVQLAKTLAKKAMAGEAFGADEDELDDATADATNSKELSDALTTWMEMVEPGDYVSIHAYVAPTDEARIALGTVACKLAGKGNHPVTYEFGPRFLHSTGQLHKGGANSGVFLQLVDDFANDLEVPEDSFTFGQLIAAQADGDAAALLQRGRRFLRIDLGDADSGFAALIAALS